MTPAFALGCLLAAPLVHAAAVIALARPPGLRDVTHIAFALITASLAVILVGALEEGGAAQLVLARPLPNVDLVFSLEPLGALVAAVVAGLGMLHAIHTAAYVRAAHQRAPARLMAFIALSIGATMAVAFSANLFTLFVSYQALILAAFPMVAHRGEADARRAAAIFLATLLGASVALLLPAMVWTYSIAGSLEFQVGGALSGRVDAWTAGALLVLFVFGIAMALMPPLHRWLPAATQAPEPALASIFALTALPAGGLALLKVTAYVFGAALIEARVAAIVLLAIAGVGLCYAALIALSKQDVHERLAYSCMAQALAVVMGALLALPVGIFASALQIVAASCAAATLFMAAGTVSAVTGRVKTGDFAGLGRVMPWALGAFALACASMIGMPPFSGAWAKLWLITASASSGLVWAGALVGVGAVLTFAHLAPLAANAFAEKAPTDAFKRPDGGSILLVAPVVLAAAATLWLLVLADPLAAFLAPVWTIR